MEVIKKNSVQKATGIEYSFIGYDGSLPTIIGSIVFEGQSNIDKEDKNVILFTDDYIIFCPKIFKMDKVQGYSSNDLKISDGISFLATEVLVIKIDK